MKKKIMSIVLILVLVMGMSTTPMAATEVGEIVGEDIGVIIGDVIGYEVELIGRGEIIGYEVEIATGIETLVRATPRTRVEEDTYSPAAPMGRTIAPSDAKAIEHLQELGIIDCDGNFSYEALVAIPAFDMQIAEPSGISAFNVLTDNRTRVTTTTVAPYARIGHIVVTFERADHLGPDRRATAYVMGRNLAVTNAHVLHQPQLGRIMSITFIPGSNGTAQAPWGVFAGTHFMVPTAFHNNPDHNDWGTVTFANDLGLGWLGMRRNTAVAVNTNIRAIGYPHHVRGASVMRQMFAGSGRVTQVQTTGTNNRIHVNAIVSVGNSGSPVLDGSIVVGTIAWQVGHGDFGTGIAIGYHTAKWDRVMLAR